ncbi:hypothetical protein HH308_18600 [Gordonia sp. TBRC 11910]|uniref:Alpha/beta hydrolase domain-containing protein n=1 Tax=Gordonia asplenii TaxID=2725283 RepID=A0A848L6J6_9ACTN|nr:alpha/beta hydrolase domain-containing protein [Gordonia asplenii]NMO03228.1 hypothetical protein [Gordonia asplenii]
MSDMPEVEALSGPIPDVAPLRYDLEALGYVDREYILRGTASAYRRRNDTDWTADFDGNAPFATRLRVRRPTDSTKFSGTVVVEWLNVSTGADMAPDWGLVHRHLIRSGHAWVGVSAQRAGIDGGGFVAGHNLKSLDADRYRCLAHPGDEYSYDIFTQVAELLRSGAGDVLGGERAHQILAIGHSQSAMFLVTYINAVDPAARVIDGYLVHGRPAVAADLTTGLATPAAVESDQVADAVRMFTAQTPVPIRDDPRVPVFVLQSESDVALSRAGRLRQPDTDRIRVWEIAGTAHADTYLMAANEDDGTSVQRLAAALRPVSEVLGSATELPINSGPQQHYVAQAAIEHLVRWADEGSPPPLAPRLSLRDDVDDLDRDKRGIALGGVRTPWVDAPVATLAGVGQGGSGFAFLFGITRPFDAVELAARYSHGMTDYLRQFTDALDTSIAQGFLLDADRAEILAIAEIDWRSQRG